MNFEPQKFFIGIVDFFSILLPGAILTYALKDWGAATFLGANGGYALDGIEPRILFVFASYLLGHFVYLLGAALDERVYEPLRQLTDLGQISNRLAKGRCLSPSWKRKLAASDYVFGKNADRAVIQALRLKARALHELDADKAVNAFQWCKARLTSDLPQGLLALQRFEADAKFFRSLFIVLGALVIFFFFYREWQTVALCLVGMLPAMWCYVDQRFKSTQQAYRYVITLEAERMLDEKRPKLPRAAPRGDGLSRAGGVVYRMRKGRPEYMLVGGSKNRSDWVLPKGHIEPGEDPRITAVREVKEESDHWARIRFWLDDRRLDENDPDAAPVRWFLLELCEEPEKERPLEDRPCQWFSFEEATDKATFDETRALLRYAEQRRQEAAASEAKTSVTHRT